MLFPRFSHCEPFKDYELIKLNKNNFQTISLDFFVILQSKTCQLMKDTQGVLNYLHFICIFIHNNVC